MSSYDYDDDDKYGDEDAYAVTNVHDAVEYIAELLGPDQDKVTLSQMQRAAQQNLYNGYYDVEAAVEYLVKTQIDTEMVEGLAVKVVEAITAKNPNAATEKLTTNKIYDTLWRYKWSVNRTVAFLYKTLLEEKKPPPSTSSSKATNSHKPTQSESASKQSSNGKLPSSSSAPSPSLESLAPTFALPPLSQLSLSLLSSTWKLPASSLSPRPANTSPVDFQTFFADMPWLRRDHLPETHFIAPVRPKMACGLLGGSSKLKALAAARRNKAAASSSPQPSSSTPTSTTSPPTSTSKESLDQVNQALGQASLTDSNMRKALPSDNGGHGTENSSSSTLKQSNLFSSKSTSSLTSQSTLEVNSGDHPLPSSPSSETTVHEEPIIASYPQNLSSSLFASPSSEPTVVASNPCTSFAQTLVGSIHSTRGAIPTNRRLPGPSPSSDSSAQTITSTPLSSSLSSTAAASIETSTTSSTSSSSQTTLNPTEECLPLPYTRSSTFSQFHDAFLQPSPDDIVLRAQAQAYQKKTKSSKKDGNPERENVDGQANVAAGLKSMSIKGSNRPKSKNLDVLQEFETWKNNKKTKKSASFVVVGHVDAGKSTLMGRLLLDLKFIQNHTVDMYRREAEKNGKQSFALAWVMDQRAEERERGVTIDIATSHFETPTTQFTILDAPGHQDFVPNMIAGASQADFAVLLIDSNTGAFEKGLKGQTHEHILLLRSLGIHRIIVAVNKMEMVGWAESRFLDISQQVTGFLTKTGFVAKNISFIPVSGLNGDNVNVRGTSPAQSWYQGPTLVEALDATEPLPRSLTRPFRMAIFELWKSTLGKLTATGRIDSGSLQIGDALLVQPSGQPCFVKSIMVDGGDLRDWAVAGDNVSLALVGVDPAHVRAGDVLCHEELSPLVCGDRFTMKALAFQHIMPIPIDLHRGRLHSAGRIVDLEAILDKTTGAILKKRPQVVQPGGVARITVKLGARIPVEAGQRVVIRSGGHTIAAGLVE